MRKWLLCKISKRIKISPKKLETRNATGHYIHNVRYVFTIFLVRNNPATNGMVHMVDRVLVPAVDTITEVLSADLHFKTMMAALEAAELSQLLAGPGHFTVFVPTDEAFDKLDEATRARILGSGGCSKDLIMSHILSEVSNLLSIFQNVDIQKRFSPPFPPTSNRQSQSFRLLPVFFLNQHVPFAPISSEMRTL